MDINKMLDENKEQENINVSTEKKEEMVTVPKSILDELRADIEKLKHPESSLVKKHTKEHIAFVRLIDGNPVIKINKTWQEPKNTPLNNEDERRLFGEFVTIGEDKKEIVHKLDFVKFIQDTSNRVPVLIKKRNEEIIQYSEGEYVKTPQNPAMEKIGYGSTDPTMQMSNGNEAIVETAITSFDVEFMNGELAGKKMTLDEQTINM